MRFVITDNKRVGDWAAVYVANKIREFNPTAERKFVLGLPTGSTPLQMYKRLIEFNKAGIISFKNVVTFNMDEYLGLEATHDQSYHYYMYNNFFNHIDIEKENINILDGKTENYEEECKRYEEKILELGGIDLFLGGVQLTENTIIANSRFFDNDITKVPRFALTVGIETITSAKEVLIMVEGENKARALHKGIESGINHMWAISSLQLHENAIIVADEAACSELKVGTYRYYKDIESENCNVDKLLEKVQK